jgi:hypothetical protein
MKEDAMPSLTREAVRRARTLAVATTMLFGGAGPGLAASPDADAGSGAPGTRRGRALGVGAILGLGSMSIGGDGRSSFVAGVSARIGLDSRNRFLLMAEVQPVGVRSPIADESFTAVNLLMGFGFGTSFKIRPVVGVQLRSWSGSQRVEARDAGLVLGVDAGPELRLTDTLSLSPEAVFRFSSIEVEGDVRSQLIGLQCVLSWGRRAPR